MNQMRTPTPVHVREPILAKRNSVREKGMLGDGDQISVAFLSYKKPI